MVKVESHPKITPQLGLTSVWAAMVIFLAGCGVHLHRSEDAQLARTASAAFKDAKLSDALKGEFDAAVQILNTEVAAIRRQSNGRRDQLIVAIIGGSDKKESWDLIESYANKRRKELLGDSTGRAQSLGVQATLQQRFDTVRQFYLAYQTTRKGTAPGITRIGARLSKKQEEELEEGLKTVYLTYINALTDFETESKKANTRISLNGLVGKTIAARDEQEKRLREANESAKKVKADLEVIKTEKEKRIAEAMAPGKRADEISKALKEAGDQTDQAKNILKALLQATSDRTLEDAEKKIIAIEEIREEISELLPAVADAVAGKKPPPGDSEKIKLLASVTAIRAGIDGAAYPRVSDLILESERLRIELDRLRGLIALEEERKTLLDLQLTALSREIFALRRAADRVETAKPSGALAADALAYIAESWSVGRTPAEEIDFLLFGIDHRVALENSSAAFAQWSNLIGIPLSQLVAYHESGIKPEDLANLINAAGLSAIAAGVH